VKSFDWKQGDSEFFRNMSKMWLRLSGPLPRSLLSTFWIVSYCLSSFCLTLTVVCVSMTRHVDIINICCVICTSSLQFVICRY
jgi:hypothetical protein